MPYLVYKEDYKMDKKGIAAVVGIGIAGIAAIVLGILLYTTSDKLKQTETDLSDTKTTLETTQSTLQKTDTAKTALEKKLSETEKTLKETQSELTQTKEILENASEAARKIAADRNKLQQDKSKLEREKETLRSKLNDIESELKQIRDQSQRSIAAIQERFKDTVGAVLDEAGRLTLDVKGKILFETGSAILSKEGKELLDAIAEEVLLNVDYAEYGIRIEGHTDNNPIAGDALRNWDLSTQRSVSAVKYLQENAGIDPKRLSGTGYAFYQPIDTEETDEAKAKNRRIEIVLVPPQDFSAELLKSLQKVMESTEEQ